MLDNIKPKALVAEDDRALADIIRMALERAAYDVSVAHDGSRALGLAQATRFDLIASDYQMPLLNGEQLLRQIRESGPSSKATMVLCSAKAYELDSERLRQELDLAAVFYKPFSLNELVRSVGEAISRREEMDANTAIEPRPVLSCMPVATSVDVPVCVSSFLPR